MNPLKIGGINGDAVFSIINHFDILIFALAQNNDGQTYLSSGTTSIIALKGMGISGTTNVSSINASNASFNNLSITTINNISINNLLIDFVDPDGNNANVNGVVTIPHGISYLHPDSMDVEIIELNFFLIH